MVQKFDLIGVHAELNKEARRQVVKKFANLDRYIPRHGRESAHLEVRLQEEKLGGKKQAVCEATLHLPRRTISMKERGMTLYAAVDILKARLKQQIKKYKDEFTNGKHRRHVVARLRRRASFMNTTPNS